LLYTTQSPISVNDLREDQGEDQGEHQGEHRED